MAIDFAAIRRALAALHSDSDATSPTVEDIFTPDQHANALDSNTPVVVGARGTGKSFWAGVLGKEDTRAVTALAYPNLHLEQLTVKSGYSGFSNDYTVSKTIIDKYIPQNQEIEKAPEFWQAVVIRAARWALSQDEEPQPIREVMEKYSDPEDAETELRSLDKEFARSGRTLLVTFDALDTLSRDWVRSSRLVDALFEAIWALRAYRSIRAKVFIRPEQLDDENLRFVELPKLRSGRVELEWGQVDLYGMLFWRLSSPPSDVESFRSLVEDSGITIPSDVIKKRRQWSLLTDRIAQKQVMDRLAGLYMSQAIKNPNKKRGTYDWPYKHLGDSQGKVTPRSFIKLFGEAAKFGQAPALQVISAKGIQHGLREASKVRVDQLGLEYKWVKRALAPLAGIAVPCEPDAIFHRWRESDTIKVILEAADDAQNGFLPPFPLPSKGNEFVLLANAMQRIGLLSVREDNRIDIPDLFRVAAMMLRRGGVPPRQKT
jgi:hypothetical protein